MEKSVLDTIGHWSQLKLEILEKYASKYTQILSGSNLRGGHFFIDAFSGPGVHRDKNSKELIDGSPLRALTVNPPFSHYHFIDTNEEKVQYLQSLVNERFPDRKVTIHNGNCNPILLGEVLSRVRYENHNRALCFFDPYGIHLKWKVIEMAGQSRAVDMFLNFSIMDMNMNVLLHDPDKAKKEHKARMTKSWGDSSWKESAYKESPLFGEGQLIKSTNDEFVAAFQQRLKDVAGFKYVARPLPIKNTQGAIVYYLIFAAAHPKAYELAQSVMSESNIAKYMIKVTGR